MTSLIPCIVVVLLLLPSLAAAHGGDPPEGAMDRTALPDVKMPELNQTSSSTLVCSMHAMLPVLGHPNWSIPRLMALTGYAFHLEMQNAGEAPYNDNLDWGLAMHVLEPLAERREAAAAYLRELTDIYPDAGKQLEAAADQYDRKVRSITSIFDICVAASRTEAKAFCADQRAEIRPLIAEALKANRAAVAQIEAVLEIVDAS